MKNKTILIFGILGVVTLFALIKTKSIEPSEPPPELGWIWDQARWDFNKWV